MFKIILKKLLPILIFVVLSFDIYAQNFISIQVLNPPNKIKPGQYFTLFLEMKSNTHFEDNVEIAIALPEGWRILMSKKPSVFKGQQSVKFIYTIAASRLAPQGMYNLAISAISEGHKIENKNQIVEVESVRKLEILALNVPEYIKEGDTLSVAYVIQNLGNTSEKIILKTFYGKIELPKPDTLTENINKIISAKHNKKAGPKSIEIKHKIDSVTIEPNKSLHVKVVQIIPMSNKDSWNTSSDLQIIMKDSIHPISKTVSISVYSSKIKEGDPYLRFPIEMSVLYSNFKFGDKSISGYQYDFRGKGDLDIAKKHYLNFIIHGPNQLNTPSTNSFDQYSFEYAFKKKTVITGGDYALKVNNLTEFGRFGRGIRLDHAFKKIEFSLFYVNPRFYPRQRDTYGGIFTIKPSTKFTLSFNMLSKTLVDNNLDVFGAHFYGFSAALHLKNFTLDNEVSSSFSQGKTDFGVFNRMNWRIGRLQINNDLIYTGKNFYGFYKDSYLLINSLNYYLSKKLSVNLVSNITRLNPSNDITIFGISPYSESNMLSLNYQLNKFNRVFLSYETREREDKSSLKRFYFNESFGRISYNIRTKKFTFGYEARLGTSQNLLVKADSSVNQRLIQHTVQPLMEVRPGVWIGGYFDYQRTSKFSDDNVARNFYYYGGSLRVVLSKIFNASVMFRNNYAPDELTEIKSFLNINANLQLGNHDLTFTGGGAFVPNAQISNQDSHFFALKYGFKFGAPIARNKKMGSIKGQVVGLSEDINLKGIIVQLGNKRFITDAKGSFQFNNLVPSKYFVNLVPSSIESGVTTLGQVPLEIIVKSDTIYKITIPLTKIAAIKGRIIFQKSESPGTIDITTQKPVVLVKLYNEKETFLTEVDSKDEFSFKEIKLGKWQVLALIPGQLDQFSISYSHQYIDLTADIGKEVIITIMPKERKINFSNKTHVLTTEKAMIFPKIDSVKAVDIHKTHRLFPKIRIKLPQKRSIGIDLNYDPLHQFFNHKSREKNVNNNYIKKKENEFF